MPDREARGRAVYDHDTEEPRPSGRRRRQVADWGVGEEMFDHLPGRRFERRQHQDVPRGDAGDGRRTIVIETGDEDLGRELPPSAGEEFTSRDEALRARERHDELWARRGAVRRRERAAEEPVAEDRWAAADAWAAEAGEPLEEPEAVEVEAPRTDSVVRGGVEGRRTVKIGGRPAEFHDSVARSRRPPRTVHERLGPRPERIAAWAFALGMLLILIAIATQNA